MADEVKIASITEQIEAEAISLKILEAARPNLVVLPLVYQEEFPKGSETRQVSRDVDYQSSVATKSEAAAFNNTDFIPTSVQITASTAGILRYLTDEAQAGSLFDARMQIAQNGAKAVAQYVDYTTAALFDGFSSEVGSTGVALTLDTLYNAMATLQIAKAPGPFGCVLHPRQMQHVRLQLGGSSGSQAVVYSQAQYASMLGPGGANGYAGELIPGIGFWSTTNLKSINTNTDWAGGMMTIGAESPLWVCWKWLPRFESIRVPASTAEQIVISVRFGVGEVADDRGVQITSKQAA